MSAAESNPLLPVRTPLGFPFPRMPEELASRMPARCSDCRDGISLTAADSEPLCPRCRAFDGVIERLPPVERVGPLRIFGQGSGEIDSCDLVQSMRRQEEIDRDATICARMLWAFAGLEALLLILAAAAMR